MPRVHRTTIIAVLALLAGTAVGAAAQSSKPMKEERPGLLAQASITAAAARKTALGRVQGGTIKSEELEREDGKLVYSFDIQVAGKSGIEEVLVDANTGAIVSVAHETPAQEAAEAAKREKAAKAKEGGKKGFSGAR